MVIALTVPGNTASWALMLRLGMERREELDFASPDFDPADPLIIVHAITKGEWQGSHGVTAS